MSREVLLSFAAVTVCVLTGLAATRVENRRFALSLAGLSLVIAGVTLAHLAASVVGVASPDPAVALSFVVLAAAGGGLLFTEVNHVARTHSGPAAIALLSVACGAGAAVYAFA